MARKKYDMINEVLAWFDFDKVHKTMVALDWGWAGGGVPDLQQLKESAFQRMSDAALQAMYKDNLEHQDIGWISNSGGLKATAWRDENHNLAKIQLEFVVSDWDADNEEVNED
jgi:hypothetical protein